MWEFPVGDGLVLVRPEVPGLFLLNPTAVLLWRAHARGSTESELVSILTGHFDVPPSRARRDIEAVLASWSATLFASVPPQLASASYPLTSSSLRRLDCRVNGRLLAVFLQEGEIWEEIAPRLLPLEVPHFDAAVTFSVIATGGQVDVFRGSDHIGTHPLAAGARAILLQALLSDTEPAAILHVGGCGGVLLAGASHSGKSTLCGALMAAGLPYHCDDSAVLDHDFRLQTMPFPLVLRRGSWPLMEARIPGFSQTPRHLRQGSEVRFLQPLQTSGPAHVTALVFVQYAENSQTVLSELGDFDALVALQSAGFWVEHTEAGIGRFLAWLGSIRRYRLSYSQLAEAELIVSRLANTNLPTSRRPTAPASLSSVNTTA